MAATQPILHFLKLLKFLPEKLSTHENHLPEIEAMIILVNEITLIFQNDSKNKTEPRKLKNSKESPMLNPSILKLILQDIITSGDYTLEGIARYTGFHMDVIHEAASGQNPNPSFLLFYRLLELHWTSRKDLYDALKEKIYAEWLKPQKNASETGDG